MFVFNFHHVEEEIQHPSRKHITMSPEGLRRFIRTLRMLGIEVVSLKDVLADPDPFQNSARSKQAILTFDDGYVNNLEFAAPVLEDERCPATVFTLPGLFGGTNEWDQANLPQHERDPLMTREQLHQLTESGLITLGSHGLYHRDFSKLPKAELQKELHNSFQMLQQEFGSAFLPVLAYPWGRYSEDVLHLMQDTPYEYAFTVQTGSWGAEDARFEVPRYSAYFRDGNPVVLLAKLCRHGLLFY